MIDREPKLQRCNLQDTKDFTKSNIEQLAVSLMTHEIYIGKSDTESSKSHGLVLKAKELDESETNDERFHVDMENKDTQEGHELIRKILGVQSKISCRLLLKDPEFGSMYDIASAMAYPLVKNERCHSMAMLPEHLKVKVNNVAEEYFGLPLLVPVPAFEIEVMENSIGTFV